MEEKLYTVLDLTNDPPTIVMGMENKTEYECCEWIDQNGDATQYTIVLSTQ